MAENLSFYNNLFNGDFDGFGGGGSTTGGGSAITVGTQPNPFLFNDEQYLVEVKSNISDANILFGNDNKGQTPNNFTFTLSELREKGGSTRIKLEKTNYYCNTEYRVNIINNPEFTTRLDPNLGGLFDINGRIGLINFNQQLFTNVLPFIVSIKKFVNGVEDSVYNSNVNLTGNVFTIEFELIKETVETIEQPIETVDIIFTNTGVNNSVKFLVNDATEIILGNNEILEYPLGTKITILSTDQTYRLKSTVISSGGQIDKREASNDLQSLQVSFVIDDNTSVSTETAEIFIPNIELPVILETFGKNERRYNKNSNSPYPIALTKTNSVDSLRVVIGESVTTYTELGNDSNFIILIPANKFGRIGVFNIQIIPRNVDGDGESINIPLNVVDDVWVGEPDIRNITYPSIIEGADYVGTNVDFTLQWESINTDYVRIYKLNGSSYIQGPATGKTTLNVQSLIGLDGIEFPQTDNTIEMTLKLVPFNISGKETLIGKEELIRIKFSKGLLDIPRPVAINRLVDGFLKQFDSKILETETSKYLTHTLNFGDADNKIITTWTGSEGSLIVKLYEPLPTSIQTNEQVWISKLQSNPILETVTVSGLQSDLCSPLKGPNFSVGASNDIGYKIYDDLIASGSETSNDLVNRYLSKLNLDTSKLNIEYVSGSNDTQWYYAFQNFVNFGSATERISNFYYKMQLVEKYKDRLASLTSTSIAGVVLTEAMELLLTDDVSEDGGFLGFEIEKFVFRNPTEGIDAQKTLDSLNTILRGFDGFELFLYKDLNVLAYPKYSTPAYLGQSIYLLYPTNYSDVIAWYEYAIAAATEFDKYNANYIVNNIPEFIYTNSENNDFVVFLDMIGQHFDTIWVYINALSKFKKLDEAGLKGVPDNFVWNILKSFGWEGKRAFDSQFLWEYAFGQSKEGYPKYSTSLEDANNQVWRRILNNLPYLLKHKGTGRAMKAIMACYGVPQSMLTIMEFGGPQDPTKGGVSEFTFDDRTAALRLQSGSSVLIPWKEITANSNYPIADYPQSIEFMFKPDLLSSFTILSSSNFSLAVSSSNTSSILEFTIGNVSASSTEFQLKNDYYSNILINRNINNGDEVFDVYLKTGDGNKIFITSSLSISVSPSASNWVTDSTLSIGNDFNGNLDEFRLWRVPLEISKFDNHTLFPDAINGNNYSSSTADLYFRLDFEFAKDLVNFPGILNVAINTGYDERFATASNFYSIRTDLPNNPPTTLYPHHYVPYDRTVTAKVPSLGFNVSNKIRFESQYTLTGQEITSGSNYTASLSYKSRATKKAFDNAPIDSNRLGLFFSPIKELNMDILKAFGDFNIDNYIGDPSDEYKDSYKKLDGLREYYFERLDRDINEYIQLVRYINKSLFDVLSDLAPARAKVSKGLLIEPHYLERNKTRWDKPIAVRGDLDSKIDIIDDVNLLSDYPTYEGEFVDRVDATIGFDIANYAGVIDENEATEIIGENAGYNTIIQYNTEELLEAEYPSYTSSIEFSLGETLLAEYESIGKYEAVGMDKNSVSNLGFGLYAPNGTTQYKRFTDLEGNVSQSRSNVFLVELTETKNILEQTNPNEPLLVEDTPREFKRNIVSIIPFDGSVSVGNSVTNVTELRGYFHTHYRYTNGLSTGLERSYFIGSTQTISTTPDGLPAVETFTTNPNVLRVAKTGRGSGEPILEVD
jgi:hypothetical protein